MSIVLESVQTGSYANTTLTITKPVGLAVGDLLIGVVHGNETGGITIPTGWTGLSSIVGSVSLITYYKIATSTEVAASNFTWTVTSGNYIGGLIARVTGHNATTPVAVFANDTETASSSPTFTSTVTPTTPDSLLFFFLGTFVNSSTSRTSSGYAIVTSNPTWTEQIDITTNAPGSATYQLAVATATRPQITATGNATVTMSGLCTELSNTMLVVRPALAFTTTETITTTEIPNPDSIVKGVTKNLSETTTITDTLTDTKQKDWNNVPKNSSTWNNVNKN
jgi:hypothetical protein